MSLNEHYLCKLFNFDKDSNFIRELINFLDKNNYQIDLEDLIKCIKLNWVKKLSFRNQKNSLSIYLLDDNTINITIKNGQYDIVFSVSFTSNDIKRVIIEYFDDGMHHRLLDLEKKDTYCVNSNGFKELSYFADDFANNNLLLCICYSEAMKLSNYSVTNNVNKKSLS